MARAIWTKLRNDPNGNWSRHEGEPPFSIPVVGGMYYDVYTDAGDSFVIMPQIAAEAPKLSGAPVVEGTFEVGQTLTAIAAPATGTPPIATAWQWLRDGVEIIGATDVTYTLKNADESKAIAVRQSDSNAHGTDSATSEGVTVAPVIPAVTAPVISGLPTIAGIAEVGQTLTATTAPCTGTAPIATTLQWLRDGTEIADATGATHALTAADENTEISVRQTDTNAQGSDNAASATVTVAPVAPVVTAPVISGLPTIAGIAEVGQTLTATAAPSTGTAPIETTLQWLRDGTEIGSATKASYALTAADEDKAISVRQTDTNAQGSDSAVSATVTVNDVSNAKTLSELAVSNQTANGEVAVVYTVSGNTGVDIIMTGFANTPTAAQIVAGLDHLGEPADAVFSDVWTTNGTDTLPSIPQGLQTNTYYLHALPAGGSDAHVATSNGFTLETVNPTVSNAVTNVDGNTIVLTMSETVLGAGDPANWQINGVSTGAPTINSVTISNKTVTLKISGNLIAGTDKITLDYAGGNVEDVVSNPLAAFSGLTVTNNVPTGYTETLVTVPASAYLTAPTPAPTGTTSLFFMFSGLQQAGYDTRASLVSWTYPVGGIWADWSKGDGSTGVRAYIGAGGIGAGQENKIVPLGMRYTVLLALTANSSGDLSLKASIKPAGGAWTTAWTDYVTNGAGAAIDDITSTTMRLFARRDVASGHAWRGQVARIAMWAAPDNREIANPGSSTVRDLFIDPVTDLTIDPAIAHKILGTPLYDFNGPVSRYNNGGHDGSLETFSKNGVFS